MYRARVIPSGQVAPPFVRLASHPLRWRLMAALAETDLRVRELTELVGEPQNLVSYHLRLLRSDGLVTARRSSFDARDSYYHLDLDWCASGLVTAGATLHPALHLAQPPSAPPSGGIADVRVLFACTGNSARSPIAEALLRSRVSDNVHVTSAGSHPKERIHPHALRVLRESFGIDIGNQRPRHLDSLVAEKFDYVITLCDRVRELCPEFDGGGRSIHWSIPDPAAPVSGSPEEYAPFTQTAHEIDNRIGHLVPVLATTAHRR